MRKESLKHLVLKTSRGYVYENHRARGNGDSVFKVFLHRLTHPRPMQKEYLGSLYFMCEYVKPKITASGAKNLGTLSRAGVPGCVISHSVVSNTLTPYAL